MTHGGPFQPLLFCDSVILFALSPSISNMCPCPHRDSASHWGSHPACLLSRLTGAPQYWAPADGQPGRGWLHGAAATRHVLLLAPGRHWQRHRAREHGTLTPRCLLRRSSGVCQQLQLGRTPPAICFLAQEPKSVFRGSKSVHLLFQLVCGLAGLPLEWCGEGRPAAPASLLRREPHAQLAGAPCPPSP